MPSSATVRARLEACSEDGGERGGRGGRGITGRGEEEEGPGEAGQGPITRESLAIRAECARHPSAWPALQSR